MFDQPFQTRATGASQGQRFPFTFPIPGNPANKTLDYSVYLPISLLARIFDPQPAAVRGGLQLLHPARAFEIDDLDACLCRHSRPQADFTVRRQSRAIPRFACS